MCGRARLLVPGSALAELFGIEAPVEAAPPALSIAPTELMAVVRLENGARRMARLRWGLVPPGARDWREGSRAFNARVETAHQRPLFREAFRRRRCLVVVDGFYEWKRNGPKTKQPYLL